LKGTIFISVIAHDGGYHLWDSVAQEPRPHYLNWLDVSLIMEMKRPSVWRKSL